MSKPTDFDEEVLATVEDVGASLDQLADLDDDQREEMGALMETLGYDEAANIVRPSRRGLLKSAATGATALATAGLVGTAATDRATAGTQSSGTWGGPSDIQDFYVEDIFDSGDNNPMSFPGDGSVSIEQATVTPSDKDILGVPDNATTGDLSFGDWETHSADRPAFLSLQAEVETDGSTNGRVVIKIDYSGGTSPDTFEIVSDADPSLGAGKIVADGRAFLLPAGASVLVDNVSDPNNNNSFSIEQIFVL